MNAFFGGNGFRVLDRTHVAKKDITFANAWGACDEDLLRWTLRQADEDAATGRPFYHFVMTTSNHRPFTYPEGRIDLPSKTSGRAGGVKYTDFAIDQFLREASTHAWYRNTVFVIVADHCASSAGRAELPVEKYHIPMIIYAPGGQVKPGVVDTLCSQVDYAPTLLGQLGMSYPSRFYGVDLFRQPQGWKGRALIGNYQKLGLYTEGHLSVLSPVRRFGDYAHDPKTAELKALPDRTSQVDDAISLYETASWLFTQKKQMAIRSDELPADLPKR
jgi:phosphoglycerol transferase MdoB-like AlkP superfamily enzyme